MSRSDCLFRGEQRTLLIRDSDTSVLRRRRRVRNRNHRVCGTREKYQSSKISLRLETHTLDIVVKHVRT